MSDETNPATAPAVAPVAPAAAPATQQALPLNPHAKQPAAIAQPVAPAAPTAAPAEPAKPFANPYAGAATVAQQSAKAAAALANERNETARLRADLDAERSANKLLADRVFAELPTEQARKLVQDLAGEDPKQRLHVIAKMKEHGQLGGPLPATVSTSQSPLAVTSATPQEDPDIAAARRLEQMEAAKAPLAAANFYSANAQAVDRGRKKLAVSKN